MKRLTLCLLLLLNVIVYSSHSEIENDYQNGIISLSEKLYYQMSSIHQPENLPEKYKVESRVRHWCGFPVFAEAKMKLEQLEEPYLSKMQAMMQRPGGLPRTFETEEGHFLIHYSIAGADSVDVADTNSNGVPDFVETVGEIFEHVYRVEIDTLGFKEYNKDDIDGESLDVYMVSLSGAYGETRWDGNNQTGNIPYILIANNFDDTQYYTHGIPAAQVTIAHEFFHALQVSYKWSNPNYYWYEVSSVWMEDYVYDDVNDYIQYLDFFFNHPNSSLDDNYFDAVYSKGIWASYISEYHGPQYIKKCWDEYGKTGVDAMETFESQIPGGLEENLLRFSYWNTFIGENADTNNYYTDGNLFPKMRMDTLTEMGEHQVNVRTTATAFIHYTPDQAGGIRLSLPAFNGLACFIKGTGYDGTVTGKLYPSDSLKNISPEFPNISMYSSIIIGLVNANRNAEFHGNVGFEIDPSLISTQLLSCRLLGKNGKPIENAEVFVYDSRNDMELARISSNLNGEFYYSVPEGIDKIYLKIEAIGYSIREKYVIDLVQYDGNRIPIYLDDLSSGDLIAYPVPFRDNIKFGYSKKYQKSFSESFELKIFNATGNLIKEFNGPTEGNYVSVDLKELTSGVYLYLFKLGGVEKKGKILKK